VSKGNYENGKQNGAWVEYNEDRTENKKHTGTFKNNMKISD
jgi:antitoxin component YwqK of YwqJK toxin-antitoxin module